MLDDGGGAGGSQARNPEVEADGTTAVAATKLFVLDTNVILHDAGCIWAFHEHDVAIPITVLEELDRFKRGNGDLNAQARAFLRQLDGITGDVLSEEGAALGEGLGRARVILQQTSPPELREVFLHDSPDHRILAVAHALQLSEPGRPVVLVSKDVNLRLKARALGVVAQDYTRDKIEKVEQLYTGKRTIENMRTEQIDAFYAPDGDGRVVPDAVPEVEEPRPNEAFVLRNGSKSVLARFDTHDFCRVEKRSVSGIRPRNAEQSFAIDALLNPNVALVTLAGRAGTGKTLLALAAALDQRRSFRQILLARPVVALGNKDLGYLPGDISAKLDPYMQPLFDNLNVLRGTGDGEQGSSIQKMLETDKLVVTPLSYIRGRTLPKVFFIVDEAQNLTPHEVKTIITRAGEGTKIVFTGDIHQIDQPYLDESSNGLSHLISRMAGHPLYAHMALEKCERSPLAECASALL